MTDSDNPLTPEEEEVRRLLAESRHTGPTPPDVVARLDRVLDDLAQEPDRVAPVVDLARRRRRVASLLVAAAAVVVIGIGVGQLVTPDPASQTTSAESGAAAEQPDAGQDNSKAGGQSRSSKDAAVPSNTTPQEQGLFPLRRDHLTDDVLSLSRLAVVKPQPKSGESFQAQAGSADQAVGAACRVDEWGQGRFVPVSYGGAPAVVVFRHPQGDTQVADLFLCGSEQPVRSVTLPAP